MGAGDQPGHRHAKARPASIGTVGVTLPGTWAAGDWNTGSYSYDGAGNITAQLADGITTESETYTYDAVSRLTRWTRAGVASESYGFDPFGNLINYNGRTLSVLGTTNRLAAAGYDASGNMTAWNGFSFSWDALDRMTALVGNGLARRFAFTADGERVLEREGSTYTFSLRGLDNRVLREMKATWTGAGWAWDWEKDSIWGAGRLLASVSRRDGIRHAHVDHLGSPRLLTNRCGQGVALLDHNPWGLDRPSGNQHGERHRFTAHQRDLGTLERTWDDFDYMHARSYTPYLGRFVSVDPGRDNDARVPQSWNLYAYVRGNPTGASDPTGKWVGVDDAIFISGGAVIGLAGQGVADIVSGKAGGWEDYASAALGGAAAGEALLYTGPVGAGAAGGAVASLSRQVLKNLSGKQEGFDATSLAVETGVGAATGFIPGARIPGANVGRGSLNQIFKQIVTKAQNGTISTVSAHTAGKMFAGRVVDTAALEATLTAGVVAGSGLLGGAESAHHSTELAATTPSNTVFRLAACH